MTITTLEALRDAIRESKGPDRELDATFARLVLGWHGSSGDFARRRAYPPITTMEEGIPLRDDIPAYLDPVAGPGALFAAARARWAQCAIRGETYLAIGGLTSSAFMEMRVGGAMWMSGEVAHPLLAHALALAMVEAAIQERDNA